ncbi:MULTISPECIES: ABC transporter permease [Brucella]|uniref:ABC transporter permease n=1 Tax=Brucella inopinata TaxID=1218315 RepID=A0AAW7BCR9_9HYPH|nr:MULTISPECIES: ABC transporter permease [Brucella]KEY06014.1 ABC transporter [Brucella suis bv. 4 str. 40]APX69630.1 ABC transporter [Brucella sp. 09RB8471]EFM56484.1 binding-protein-dependent transport systems inner membrane component [Brucella inopinata BO1]MDL2333804.1 ABC transporter permease [Brucella inopinata]MRN42968.1 ABC transporter permease subunit [Brucella sp. 09RB8913]
MKLFLSLLPRMVLLAVLLLFLLHPHLFEPVFRPFVDAGTPVIYDRANLMTLTLQHLGLVALATFCSTLIAVAMAIFVTRRQGAEFLPLSRSLVNIGQTFPPVAVLALAVPVFGFGDKPTLIALFLYGLLPIFENTLTGLTSLPPPIVEAARGMGMTGMQRLFKVEMPLAMPVILAGIRLSAVIGLATATIGSTVAAKTLGEVIIAGLISNNLAFVLEGGLVVAALAILIFDAFQAVEHYLMKRTGRTA